MRFIRKEHIHMTVRAMMMGMRMMGMCMCGAVE